MSNREIQHITMTTSGLYNVQELRLTLNWSAINEQMPTKFNIEWAGKISKQISFHNITTTSGTPNTPVTMVTVYVYVSLCVAS